MDVKEAVETRRSFRALAPVQITDAAMKELATAAQLAASCYNNQPWKFVFVKSDEALAKVHACLSKGNEWAKSGSLVIAAFAAKDRDCVIKEREYYLFDLGMAVSAMLLRANEMGLVAHPIAGFDDLRLAKELGIPPGNTLLTLVIVGKKSVDLGALNPQQAAMETGGRPDRLPLANIYSVDSYSDKLDVKPAH